MSEAARSGFEENERTPITGFSGFTFTSATGAKFWLIPIARSSLPVTSAADFASLGSRAAPSAMLPGNWVAGSVIRTTRPCSWSVEISAGISGPDEVAARWTPFDRPAIWRGFCTLPDQAK